MVKTFCDLCDTEIPKSEASRSIIVSGAGIETQFEHVCRRCNAAFADWAKDRSTKAVPERRDQ